MEDLNKIFEKYVKDEVITESAKTELNVVFESMVNEAVKAKVDEKTKAIMEEFNTKFETVVEEHNTNTKKHLSGYLKLCAEEFAKENKIALKNAIIVEKAKNIIAGLQSVFEQNGISLPEGDSQVVEEMNTKNASLTKDYNKSVNKNVELANALEESEKAIIFMKSTSTMSDVSKEKLINLMSGLVVENVSEFKKKLEILRGTLVTEAKKKGKKKPVKEEDENGKEDEEEDEDELKKKDAETAEEEKDEDGDGVEDKVDNDEDEDKKEVAKEDKNVSKWLKKMSDVRVR